ncbi:hypothetical protein [Mycobacterium sp. NAZ190054]|uniref:hypothetical protein n=1 Tax=Mycobacterium sp. NAZ190054 TaxID=1747766 RepID=UPI0007920369|nr:hypothetical protein [Mycobacterium sp. NAZ190054]KWX68202.1 hypothetical protein ASJ79_18600 [Mycobacterium sp. NAZ190054]
MRNLGPVLSALGVIAVVTAAAVVWHNLPTPTDLYGTFDVHGRVGEPVRGRAVTATVTSVRVAPQVNSAQAAGSWVVVDTTLEATGSTELPHADLLVGPNTYVPTDRFFGKTLGAEIAPGISQRGSWVFDVASPLVAAGAADPVTLRVWVGSGMLDSRLVIELDADRFARTGEVDLAPPEASAA